MAKGIKYQKLGVNYTSMLVGYQKSMVFYPCIGIWYSNSTAKVAFPADMHILQSATVANFLTETSVSIEYSWVLNNLNDLLQGLFIGRSRGRVTDNSSPSAPPFFAKFLLCFPQNRSGAMRQLLNQLSLQRYKNVIKSPV